MTSHDLMNINLESYKCKHSDARSRSMWQLNDIIPIIINDARRMTGGV